MGAEDLNKSVPPPESGGARDKRSRGDLCLGGSEVVGDLVPEVGEVGEPIGPARGAEEGHSRDVLAAISEEMLLVEDHVVGDHRVIVQVHDVLAVCRQTMSACPQSPCLVPLRDEDVLHLRVHRLDHLEGVVGWPVEVAVVADADVLGRDELQDLPHHIADLCGALVAGNDHTDAAKEVRIIAKSLPFVESMGQEQQRQEEDRWRQTERG
jgi:hypothetical protein